MKTELVKWDPFKELTDFQTRLSSLMRGEGNGGLLEESTFDMGEWSPAVDISEDEKAYLIKADLPEVKKSDISVKVENGMLTITGERKREEEEKKKKFHRVERSYGKYVRSFRVPENSDPDKIDAKSKDGVLEIRLPKTTSKKSKGVEVKVQ